MLEEARLVVEAQEINKGKEAEADPKKRIPPSFSFSVPTPSIIRQFSLKSHHVSRGMDPKIDQRPVPTLPEPPVWREPGHGAVSKAWAKLGGGLVGTRGGQGESITGLGKLWLG